MEENKGKPCLVVRFKVFMAVKIQVEVFWFTTWRGRVLPFWRTLLPPFSG
jgi:hypothetical protein